MKKVVFSIFTLALITMVGCQKSDITENNDSNNEAQLITVTATIDDASKTRVALTPDSDNDDKPIVKVAWKAGDETFKMYGVEHDPVKIYGPNTFTQIDDTNKFSGENEMVLKNVCNTEKHVSNRAFLAFLLDQVIICHKQMKENYTAFYS